MLSYPFSCGLRYIAFFLSTTHRRGIKYFFMNIKSPKKCMRKVNFSTSRQCDGWISIFNSLEEEKISLTSHKLSKMWSSFCVCEWHEKSCWYCILPLWLVWTKSFFFGWQSATGQVFPFFPSSLAFSRLMNVCREISKWY